MKTKITNLLRSSYTIDLAKGTIFPKKRCFFCKKNAGISKVNGALVLKGRFSETTYGCVLRYQILNFQHNSKKFQTGAILQKNKPVKIPPRLGLTNWVSQVFLISDFFCSFTIKSNKKVFSKVNFIEVAKKTNKQTKI